jgi:hypothetical protein
MYKQIAKDKELEPKTLGSVTIEKSGYNFTKDENITRRINSIIMDSQKDNLDNQFKYISWLIYYNENSGGNGKIIKIY